MDHLELDLSPGDRRRRRGERSEGQSSAQGPKASGRPGSVDLAEAARIAAYADSSGILGAVFYSLSAGPRRRKLRRELRATEKKLAQAEKDIETALMDYGRGVHGAAATMHLPSLQKLVGIADHAVLRQGQLKNERRRKKERAIQDERVDKAIRKIAEVALHENLTKADPEGLRKYRLAEHTLKQLRREVWLRKIGIDLYDPAAVRRGRLFLLVPIGLIAAAAFSAWQAGELPGM